jgi:hypothetical protein
MAKQESSKLKSTLEEQIQNLEPMLERVDAKAEEYKPEAGHHHPLWLSLCTDLGMKERRHAWLASCLAVERRKSSRLERKLQAEERSKEGFVSATSRAQVSGFWRTQRYC